MEEFEQAALLLSLIDQISSKMRDIILLNYYDKLDSENKHCLAMMAEAYSTATVFCYAIKTVSLTQAGLLLRQFLEQTAIAYILVKYPETLSKYVEHYKMRNQMVGTKKCEQYKMIKEKYGVPNDTALSYLDYGWIGFDSPYKCNEEEMLKFAEFSDIIVWKKMYLDKMAHASFTSSDFLGETKDFPVIKNFTEIACKLFDYLCVAFHNLTNFNFIFDNRNLFAEFRNLYSNYKL